MPRHSEIKVYFAEDDVGCICRSGMRAKSRSFDELVRLTEEFNHYFKWNEKGKMKLHKEEEDRVQLSKEMVTSTYKQTNKLSENNNFEIRMDLEVFDFSRKKSDRKNDDEDSDDESDFEDSDLRLTRIFFDVVFRFHPTDGSVMLKFGILDIQNNDFHFSCHSKGSCSKERRYCIRPSDRLFILKCLSWWICVLTWCYKITSFHLFEDGHLEYFMKVFHWDKKAVYPDAHLYIPIHSNSFHERTQPEHVTPNTEEFKFLVDQQKDEPPLNFEKFLQLMVNVYQYDRGVYSQITQLYMFFVQVNLFPTEMQFLGKLQIAHEEDNPFIDVAIFEKWWNTVKNHVNTSRRFHVIHVSFIDLTNDTGHATVMISDQKKRSLTFHGNYELDGMLSVVQIRCSQYLGSVLGFEYVEEHAHASLQSSFGDCALWAIYYVILSLFDVDLSFSQFQYASLTNPMDEQLKERHAQFHKKQMKNTMLVLVEALAGCLNHLVMDECADPSEFFSDRFKLYQAVFMNRMIHLNQYFTKERLTFDPDRRNRICVREFIEFND